MPRVIRYPEVGNHVKIQKKHVPTELQNQHFRQAAGTDWLTCEVLRVDIERHANNARLDRRVARLRHPPNPADSICEFVCFASKCEILQQQPQPAPAPAVNARELVRRRQGAANAEPVVSHAIKRYSDFNVHETAAVWGDSPPIRKRKTCSECKTLASYCCVCSTNVGLCINCFPKHVITCTRIVTD